MKNKEYKLYKNCRFCGSKNVKEILDFGLVPLAGGFLKNEDEFVNEKKYPLRLIFCKDCFLLQVDISINPDTIFKNYFYFSSSIKTLVDHFNENAKNFSKLLKSKDSFVVEIGCNDGSFINAMRKQGFKVLGVDPAKNVVEHAIKNGLSIINDYFTDDLAKKVVKKYGKVDLIFSSNTLAHIEDMHSVFRGIFRLLRNDGLLVFEVHYLPKLIKEMQYDMIYHEHQYYYSLLTLQNFLKRFKLEIYDAKLIPIHGGSIQIHVKKISANTKKTKRLKKLIIIEKKQKIGKVKTYIEFRNKIEQSKEQLLKMLYKIKSDRKSIVGYGASGRGTIVMNYCDLNKDLVDYVIDDAPAKIGAYMPGTHQKIVSSKILRLKKRPDYVVLFAWPFLKEISSKNKGFLKSGGKFIFPLPKVRIIN